MPTSDEGGFERLRATLRHPVIAICLGLVGAQAIHRAIVLQRNWFYTDDYLLLLEAQGESLDWGYLMDPFNSHVMPATRLIYWVVEASGPLNWPLAVTFTVLIQFTASLAAVWMLLTLFGRRWGVVALLSLYVTTAITAQATLWWVSSLNQLSIQAMFFLAVGAWVNYLRTRSWSWLLASAGAVALGLLFFQKILLVLPVMIGLGFFYFTSGSPRLALVGFVRRYWISALVMGGVAAAYLVYFVTQVQQPFAAGRVDWDQLAWNMVSTALLGGVGGPWAWEWRPGGAWVASPDWLRVAALIAVGLVAALTIRRRRHAWPAWALLGAYLAVGVILVGSSRAPVYGAEIGLAYRLQTDVTCVIVLILGLAFLPLEGASRPSTLRPGPRPRRDVRPVLAVSVAAVSVSGLLNWTLYEVSWHEHNTSREYVQTFQDHVQLNEPVDLAETWVPHSVLPPALFPGENTVRTFVRLLDADVSFPVSSGSLRVTGDDGSLNPPALDKAVRSKPGPHDNCGWLASKGRPLTIPLQSETWDWDWWIRIDYLADADDEARLIVAGERITVALRGGINSLYSRTPGQFDEVRLEGLQPETSVCVDLVEVGTIQPRDSS